MNQQAVQLLAELNRSGCHPLVGGKIGALLESGADFDLYKINAFRIARDLGLDPAETLRGFLFATRLGLFDLNWDIYCPSCGGLPEYFRHMMGLKRRAHCELCEIDWDLDFEEQVEVTFTVNPAVRAIDYKDFGERDFPGKMAFIRETQGRVGRELESGECIFGDRETEIAAAFAPGRYRYWVTGSNTARHTLVVRERRAGGPQSVEVAVDGAGSITPDELTLDAGPVTFRVRSGMPGMNGFLVERDRATPDWVSAHYVAMQQEFKELFDAEFLSPETSFAVRNVTLMFTDLKDSTRLYEEIGDSRAFSLVRRHFDVMIDSIRRCRGGIVKTIGDAVMAAFPSNADALRAAMAIQAEFLAPRESLEGLQVKIGIHRGPVIAVNSNQRLDYFGRTVNLAARVQGRSLAGEVLLSGDVAADPAVRDLIAAGGWKTREFTAALKGIAPDPTLTSVSRG